MSQVCEISGVGPTTGNKVSHSNIKTRTRWMPNIKIKRFAIPETGEVISLRLTARTIRSVDKQGGISAAILKAKDANLSERLKNVKLRIMKARRTGTTSSSPVPTAPAKATKAAKAAKPAKSAK
jgi:large subunit ribosomal protein L28